jgi:hypothetical protein
MSRATVTTFGRGVSFVASGETGTQANEFEAAIKSVTSSTTVGAVFLYDTRSDSDGGAWRKKARGSWYYEDLNTATRGGRREFPSVALLVVDNASGAGGITVYDLDDPSMPMFMVFSKSGTSINSQSLCSTDDQISCVYALNGRIYFGTSSGGDYYGLRQCDLTTDTYSIYNYGAGERVSPSSDRNAIHDWAAISANAAKKIVNNTVNDVAATIVEGSEIGALGLPIPTVAVGCGTGGAGGVSIIHANGTVTNWATSGSEGKRVAFTKNNSLLASQGQYVTCFPQHTFYTAVSTSYISSITGGHTYYQHNVGGTSKQVLLGSAAHGNFLGDAIGNDFAAGSTVGLSLVKKNDGNNDEGAIAYITSDYNTGYQLGDIRLAVAAIKNATVTAYDETGNFGDRSVKGNTLTNSGTITCTPVATGAEAYGLSGFDTSNYLSRANDTDFDFGTGDFSISLWVKNTDWSGDKRLLGRSESTTAKRLSLYASGTTLTLYLRDGADTLIYNTNVLKNNVWQHVFAFRKSSKLYLYVDGRSVATPVASTTNITPTSAAALVIGAETFDNLSSISNPLTNGSLSLVRISATAPTPTQVKEIYEAEKPLFRSGAKCLLSQVTHTAVNDLAYDNSSDLLYVGTTSADAGDSVSVYRGLERVDTKDGQDLGWDGASANLLAAAGGVVGYARTSGTGGLVLDIPPFDVRGDTNISDSKSSNDGKIRFTGVTASTATPTVIGHIPIAIGEKVTVKARVQASVYNTTSLNGYYEEITATFQRPYDTGTVAAHTSFSNPTHSLSDTTLAGLDVELSANDTAKTCEVKVTGSASYRMQWNATVEVQRISEKTYER